MKTYKIGTEEYLYRPLLIVDYRVICHKLYNLFRGKDLFVSGADQTRYIKALWAYIINAGPDFVDCTDATVVIVDDCKPYWRSDVFPDYKRGRPEKTEDFYSVANIGLRYVTNSKAPWAYLSKQGYEADDWAGAFVAAKRAAQTTLHVDNFNSDKMPKDFGDMQYIAERPIVLWTVDTDWLQLAGDGVWWANTGPWTPLLRGTKETQVYCKKAQGMHKQTIEHPHEIVDIKMKYGDKSDNLAPGTGRHMIDLINVPAQYNLRYQPEWELIQQCLKTMTPSMDVAHYNKAKRYILATGLPFP